MDEAGEDFSTLASELERYQERLGSVLSHWQEGIPELRQKLSEAKDSIFDDSRISRSIALMLYEVIDYYTQAERKAMEGSYTDKSVASHNIGLLPNIRMTSNAVLFDRTIMPDWLQSAVLRYMQDQGD